MTPESEINLLTPYVVIAGMESRNSTAGAMGGLSELHEAIRVSSVQTTVSRGNCLIQTSTY